MNVKVLSNIYDINNDSLVWYHNDSQILSGGRRVISDNNTRLTINNLRDYDAGVYKVNFSYSCEYPLASNPDFVPVIFIVQEHSLPVYDPLTTVSTYYITDRNGPGILLNTSVPLQYIDGIYGDYWHKDGVRVPDSNTSTTEQNGLRTDTLELTGDSAAGIYMVALQASYDYGSSSHSSNCFIAYRIDLFHTVFAIGFSVWNVKSHRKLLTKIGGTHTTQLLQVIMARLEPNLPLILQILLFSNAQIFTYFT